MTEIDNQVLILQQTAIFVQKDFEVESIPKNVTEEELLAYLGQVVYQWIDSNMEHLFYVLYRLDINEKKVSLALDPTALVAPHKAIAQLILDREKQKAKSRIEYNKKSEEVEGDGWND